ncbi:hypothetical protein [Mesotoga sp. UBA5847]|uniref:hypothetical protein n=1 Tax=Mesotoga sp. UBA5847 TaxID=1946859 RepID=UPI0025E3879C|nr:hypothetical protein [Mesotoga sp. UBA5847]
MRSDLHCKEVWLPAIWLLKLEDLLSNPCSFLSQLSEEINEFCREEYSKSWRISLSGFLSEFYLENRDKILRKLREGDPDKDTRSGVNDAASRKDETELMGFVSNLVTTERVNEYFNQSNSLRVEISKIRDELEPKKSSNEVFSIYVGSRPYIEFTRKSFLLLKKSVTPINNLVEIVKAASSKQGIDRIRFFLYDEKMVFGGHVGILEPLNSYETSNVNRISQIGNTLSALEFLALTVVNEQSLVFRSPSSSSSKEVIFFADSDFNIENRIFWEDGMIATTPHHGSKSNRGPYDLWSKEGRKRVIWLRTYHHSTENNSHAFLQCCGQEVHCTKRHKGEKARNIIFVAENGSWK